jgi:glutamate racemase
MIGIFDSGSGGLTVLKALREVLPSADVVYFGDIKNAPYGEKTQEELSLLTVDAIRRLRDYGADRIISACNSVSASLALSVFDAFDLVPGSIIEMVGPTVSYFKDSSATLALCATPATIRSGIYQNAFRMIGKDIEVTPIPGLAGAIEFGAPDSQIEQLIQNSFKNLPTSDVIILACTHYPLVFEMFERALPGKQIFDPAVAVAGRAKKLFWPQEVRDGKTLFIISKESEQFRHLVAGLFPDARNEVKVLE